MRVARFLRRSLGCLLILCGLLCAFAWFYLFAPLERISDPRWCRTHSQFEYWQETQKGIRRGVWNQLDSYFVGFFGDKTSAEWMMSNLRPNEPDDTMDDYYWTRYRSSLAMWFITNQRPGDDVEHWLRWWQTNKSKSQVEWIKDGFRQRGITVSESPTAEQIESLLALLGDRMANRNECISTSGVCVVERWSDREANQDEVFPTTYVSYNAFRWLRDSGFNSTAYAISNQTVSAKVKRGLLRYSRYENMFPVIGGAGILPLKKAEDYLLPYLVPNLSKPDYHEVMYLMITLFTGIGVTLAFWPFRKKHVESAG